MGMCELSQVAISIANLNATAEGAKQVAAEAANDTINLILQASTSPGACHP